MALALALGARGLGRAWPNPAVGAVIVRNDGTGPVIVGRGWTQPGGRPHAETEALQRAGEAARGATLYVTLEPCGHHGKTPPCADAIVAAGIARVVAASEDINPEARGGAGRLRAANIPLEIGVEREAAREQNAAFFHRFASDRPFITLKLAMSLDGAIANAAGTRGTAGNWLTGEEARREVHHMRAGVDAIAVGVGTVLADDPQLTVRDAPAPRVAPRRVIFDSELRTPVGAAVVQSARLVPTILIARRADRSRREAFTAAGVDVRVHETLQGALIALAKDGMHSLLVEGGARLAGSLIDQAMVDRLVIFQAPVVLGEGALNAFAHVSTTTAECLARLHVIERVAFGDDLKTTYAFGAQ